MTYDLTIRLEFARKLARDVGREALRFWNESQGKALGVEQKSTQDFVTIADKQAEDTIKSALKQAFPEDGFIGEETGGTAALGWWTRLTAPRITCAACGIGGCRLPMRTVA